MFSNLRRWTLLLIPVMSASLGGAQDGTSNTILFQTRVQTPEGEPFPNGSYPFQFSIYATENDSNTLWTETQPLVEVTDGLSNTIIFGETPPPSNLFDQWDSLWLEVAIDRDNDGFDAGDVFNPRTPLHAVPFALYAKDAASLGGSPAGDYAKQAEVEALESLVTSGQAAQDAAIAEKVSQSDYDTKMDELDFNDQVNYDIFIELYLTKADATSVYTKTETDSQQAAQDAAIAEKVSQSDYDTKMDELDFNDQVHYDLIVDLTSTKADTTSLFQWSTATGNVQAVKNRGYLLTGSAPQTVTLPLSASLVPGDIVRVSGNGALGWRVAQNANQQILTTSFDVPDFSGTWTARESSLDWRKIASSADGMKLVAVAFGNKIYTSTNAGISWTPRENFRNWWSVCSSQDGTKLAATVLGGQIYTSTDSGVSWSPRESNRQWRGIACSADGTTLVAAVEGGKLYVSTDSGVSWTARETDRNWNVVACSADGSRMAAGGFSTSIYTSSDTGANWSQQINAGTQTWRSIAMTPDGAQIFAGDDSALRRSSNFGVSWSSVASGQNWYDVKISDDGSIVVAVEFTFGSGAINVSTDGGSNFTRWRAGESWRIVTCSSDGKRLVAGKDGGQLFTYDSYGKQTRRTTVGTSGNISGSAGSAVELQYVGSDTFIPISHAGDLGVR